MPEKFEGLPIEIPSQTDVFGWHLMVPVSDKASRRDAEQAVAIWLEEEIWKGLDSTTNPTAWRTRREWLPLPDYQSMLCLSLTLAAKQPCLDMAVAKAHLKRVVDRMKSPCVPLTPRMAWYRMMGLDFTTTDAPDVQASNGALAVLVERFRLAHAIDLPSDANAPGRKKHL
jgi:hypothetical protein